MTFQTSSKTGLQILRFLIGLLRESVGKARRRHRTQSEIILDSAIALGIFMVFGTISKIFSEIS
ncbi:hypothetical protein KBT16_28290 [Nostoc sp. CCCryo 231-06]|nr:hypothetical protein [Nostoc sp. CCCryo 231-06]